MRHNTENRNKAFLRNKESIKKKTKAGGLVMKTKNNVQQAILKSLAVITSLVIISLTVSAQDYWKSLLGNFNEVEFAMVDNITIDNRAEAGSNSFDYFLNQETDEILELENWMIDESNFTTLFLIDEEFENPLNVEDWMTDATSFIENSFYLEVETEGTLNLENWMTEANYFEASKFQIVEETDAELGLEDWMLDEELFTANEEFEQPLELESWMISANIW